jgi:hypothetical protein
VTDEPTDQAKLCSAGVCHGRLLPDTRARISSNDVAWAQVRDLGRRQGIPSSRVKGRCVGQTLPSNGRSANDRFRAVSGSLFKNVTSFRSSPKAAIIDAITGSRRPVADLPVCEKLLRVHEHAGYAVPPPSQQRLDVIGFRHTEFARARASAQLHHSPRWRSQLAASRPRATEGNAGDRSSRRRLARGGRIIYGRAPRRAERNRLCRGAKFGDRIPLGGGSL